MSFYNTGNPVPSIDPRDLDDNAKHIDDIVNSTELTFVDRLGTERLTMAGLEAEAAASVTLRLDLAQPDGADLVGIANGATVGDAIKHVVPTALTSAAVLSAITYAAANGLSVEIPDGTYTGTNISTNLSVSIVLRPNAFLNFDVEVAGRIAMQSNSVTLAGDFPVYPVGTTTFAGNFSDFATNDVVMIELSAGGSQAFNEVGVDFAVVQTASATQLVLTTGTRLAYRDPKISKLSNVARYTGTVAKDSITIPGNFTAQFVVGDIVRIENVDGIGGVEGSSFYFEFGKISTIDATQITLETRTVQPYTNPWLVKVDAINGVKITGGRIRRLTVRFAQFIELLDVDVDRAIYGSLYRYQIIGSIRRGLQEPSTSNATWLFNGSMSDIYCGGSLSSTDNAAFKVLSCPNMQLLNISGGNTKATAQGNYGVFIDYFNTPYKVWNENLQAENIRGETPNGGSTRGVWVTGVRNGDLEITGGRVFLQKLADVSAEINCAYKQLEIADLVRCTVKGICNFVTWEGCIDSGLYVTVRDTLGANSNRCCWARGGDVNPETGVSYSIGSNNEFNVVNYSTNASDITLYLQNQDLPLVGAGCRDKTGLSTSVTFGSSLTNPRMSPNFFRNSMPSSSLWTSARVKGYINFDGGFQDGGFLQNSVYYFTDTIGNLKNSGTTKPASNAAGNPVALKVAVPASSAAAGIPGNWAASATFYYAYTGDGTTHSWSRVAIAVW